MSDQKIQANDLRQKAISYVKNSKVSVIPVGKNKIPLIPWKEFQDRFPTETEINDWFDKHPDAQIGIVTGRISNLIVVDIENGGDPSFLPQDTYIVKTGGGGWHYYFRFTDGLTNKARIRDLVDIRAEGGYVVAPGSTSDKGPYSIIRKGAPLPFPKGLFPNNSSSVPSFGIGSDEYRSISSVLDYPGYGSGQRNDQMTRFIGSLLTKIHPSEWDSIGWQIVVRANDKNTPPLAQNELKATFESVKRLEARKNPTRWLRNDYRGNRENDVLDQGDPVIFDSNDDEVKHLAQVADEQKINQEDIYPLEMPCFDEAILGGVSPGDIIVIAGKTGEGKTSLTQDWTMSMIRGLKKAKVLWFSYEVLPSHLWRKFQSMGMTKEDCAFIPAKHSTGNVSWVEKKIIEAKEKFGVKAVMIDHLGFLLPKTNGILGKNLSQNYSSFLTQIVRDLKSIALKEEIIIFLPVHMRKTDDVDMDAIKDSVGISQEADLVFLIERERNKNKDATSYYTDITKITLAKNRKTGKTVVAYFTLINERFAYNKERNDVEKAFDEIAKDIKEMKKTEVQQTTFNRIDRDVVF